MRTVSTESNPLALSVVPDLDQVFRSGSPLLLAYETVGFSPNELTEIFKFDVLINGTQKSVFWLYDHKTQEFDENSVNETIAQRLSMSADDIALSHVIISGTTWDPKLTLTYTISGDNRVFISQIHEDGSFIPDLIEHISGDLNVGEITRLASEKELIFLEISAALSQVDAGKEISPQQLVLDTNESRDIYIVDPVNSHVKLASTIAGQIIQGHSELVDTFSDADVTRLLIRTKEPISADDNNEKYDFLIIDLDNDLSVKTLKWISNPDGSFFNQGISAARFYDSTNVLIETNSTNLDVQNFDQQTHFLKYEIETDTLTSFTDVSAVSDVSLTNVKLLDAASNNSFLIFTGTDVNGDGSEQVYLHSTSLSKNSSTAFLSTFFSNQLSVNDGVLSARISDFGTKAALNLYSPYWVQGFALGDQASFSVNHSFLSTIDLGFAPPIFQILGILKEEETLSLDTTLPNTDGLSELSYQWYAGEIALEGETSLTLILDQQHVGKDISVSVGYSDDLGNEASFVVSATSSVENVNDAPTGTITITGTATQGETLTAENTLSDLDGLGDLSYQWYAGENAIEGATSSTLVLGQSLVGEAIKVEVAYTDGYGTDESVTSAATSQIKASDKKLTTTVVGRDGSAFEGAEIEALSGQFGTSVTIQETDTADVYAVVANYSADVSSIDFKLSSSTAITEFSAGSAIEGWTGTVNDTVSGVVSYSAFGAVDDSLNLSAGNDHVLATFKLGDATTLSVTEIMLNEDNIEDVIITHAVTDSVIGNTTVMSIDAGHDVLLNSTLSVDAVADKSVGAWDALQALRIVVGLSPMQAGYVEVDADAFHFIAADINRDGKVRADDALNILKYAVGFEDYEADWVFIDSAQDLSGVNKANVAYSEGVSIHDMNVDVEAELTAILVGDVDGSYFR